MPRRALCSLVLAAVASGTVPVEAQETAGVETAAAPSNDFADAAALGAFVDGVIEAYMEADELAGATVSIVKDGEVVLLRGYGLASADPPRPVDPSRDLFRVGSISKTFVWTALMQLVEEGRLSLDDPVNDHLPDELDVPDEGFDEPIRIRHLMSHTPGFEDTAVGHLFVRNQEKLRPLPVYLATFRPHRVRPPGDFTTYSNYGAALAGYVVQRVTALHFEDYVEQRIFEPLGMTRSTFREPHGESAPPGLPDPMPAGLAETAADGLEWEDGAWKKQDWEFISPVGPAGAMSSTAADMARYMRALLNEGELDGRRILDAGTARTMRETLFANADGMSGLAHGFLQYSIPGRYANFGHGGATLHFMSNMVLVPELDLGVFVSTNTGSGRDLVVALPVLLLERFFDPDEETPAPPEDFAARGEAYAGTYLNTRRAYTLLEKIVSMGNLMKVRATDEGYLVTESGDRSSRWVEVGEHLFREVDGDRFLAFRVDDSGRATHVFHSFGITAGERISFFGGPGWLGIVAGCALVTAIGMTTGGWLRRRREIPQSPAERWASGTMWALGILWLAFFAVFGAALGQIASMGDDVVFDFPTGLLVAALAVLLVCAALTLVAALGLIPVWRKRSWPVARRIRHTLAVLILLALVVTLHHWNLIGFRYF